MEATGSAETVAGLKVVEETADAVEGRDVTIDGKTDRKGINDLSSSFGELACSIRSTGPVPRASATPYHGFRSLSGAMYLQIFWLSTKGGVRRCKEPGCPRFIAFEYPERQRDLRKKNDRGLGYETRRDKVFRSSRVSSATTTVGRG